MELVKAFISEQYFISPGYLKNLNVPIIWDRWSNIFKENIMWQM